jgi:NADPH:quinone reductase-like Zn-dependent oxidoreductase
MKAFLIRKYKSPLELAEVPIPEVGPQDVLVKVAAASLNQLDEMLRVGTFRATLPYKLPLTLGNDFAGEVVEIGREVRKFKVGDYVFGKPNQSRIGTFAEFIAADQNDIALKPPSISMVEAASIALVGLTAWQALVEQGKVAPGHRVLIHGGAGGVGAIAIQVAKALGATVATTASAANASFVKDLGADIVIDYSRQDFSKMLKDFDLVLDSRGGSTLMKSLQVLRTGGLAIGIAGPPDEKYARQANLPTPLRWVMSLLSSKVNRAAKKLGVRYEFLFVQSSGQQLTKLAGLISNSSVKPAIGKVYRFDQTPEGLENLVGAKIGRGKAVIDFELNCEHSY